MRANRSRRRFSMRIRMIRLEYCRMVDWYYQSVDGYESILRVIQEVSEMSNIKMHMEIL